MARTMRNKGHWNNNITHPENSVIISEIWSNLHIVSLFGLSNQRLLSSFLGFSSITTGEHSNAANGCNYDWLTGYNLKPFKQCVEIIRFKCRNWTMSRTIWCRNVSNIWAQLWVFIGRNLIVVIKSTQSSTHNWYLRLWQVLLQGKFNEIH